MSYNYYYPNYQWTEAPINDTMPCESCNCRDTNQHRFVKHHGQYYYQDIPYSTHHFHKTAHKVVFVENDLRCKEYHPSHTHLAPLSAGTFTENCNWTSGADNYITEIALRRTHYDLKNTLPAEKSLITEVIKKVISLCPSAFNVQSSRIVILYGNEHQRLWDIVKSSLLRVTTEAQYRESEQKINGCFASGAGTILFYEDMDAIRQQQEQYPTYATQFPVWSQHSSAIAQFAVWTALAQLRIGASLQHYNDLIVDDVRKAYDIPINWKLIAQMPFGEYERNAPVKTFIPDDRRFIVREDEEELWKK